MATAMATHSPIKTMENGSTDDTVQNDVTRNVSATNNAANTNHLSCWRSSPRLRRNRTTAATTEITMPARRNKNAPQNVVLSHPGSSDSGWKGCRQVSVAEYRASPMSTTGPAPTTATAGRHLRDGSRAV